MAAVQNEATPRVVGGSLQRMMWEQQCQHAMDASSTCECVTQPKARTSDRKAEMVRALCGIPACFFPPNLKPADPAVPLEYCHSFIQNTSFPP